MARVRHYSDFLNSIAALIGLQVVDLQTDELAILNTFFNKGMKYIWQQANWMDVCPYGEYRVPNNIVQYGKNFANSNWTKTAVVATAGALPNPVDVQSDGSTVLETPGTSAHSVSQNVTFLGTQYCFSVFAQAMGRNFIELVVTDSAAATYSAFFNLTANGSIVSSSGTQNQTIQAISGLWYQCMISFTPASGQGAVTINLSSNGSTTNYAGVSGIGAALWGASSIPTQPSGVSQQLIPWEQPGEAPIDVVYDVFNMTPIATSYPSRLGYKLTNNGIQLINATTGWNAQYYVQNPQAATTTTDANPLTPAYLSYRKRVPDYFGAPYNAGTAYTYGQQVYFTSSTGTSDYYSCAFPNTGSSPDAAPADWTALTIPYAMFDYANYSVYADWLRTEGQMTKAQIMDATAQDLMDREADRQERQMASPQSWRVFTHLTSRPNPIR